MNGAVVGEIQIDVQVQQDWNKEPTVVARILDRIKGERMRNKGLRELARLEMDYYIGNVVQGTFASDTYFAVENRVAPLVDQIACRIAETRPTGTCIPVNGEEQERAAARERDELIYSEFTRSGIYTELTYLMAQCAATTGAAYLSVHWDPRAGSKYDPTDEDQVLMYQNREAQLQGSDLCPLPAYLDGSRGEYFTGGIDVEALDQHEFGYDPYAGSLMRSTWCYRRYFPLKEEADARWPQYASKLQPAVAREEDYSAPDDGARSRFSPTDRVLIDVYYERPSPKWPKGCVAYMTQDFCLEIRPELPFGVFPFWEVRDRPVIRRGPGLGRVRDQVPLARELNNRLQRLKEQMDKAGGINIMVPQGGMLNQSFLDETVTVYEYDGHAGRPEQFQLSPNPSQAMRISDIRSAMNEIGGLPDFTRGRMPSGISGRTIGLYDAQIASLLGQLARSVGSALEGLASWTLQAWREYAPPTAMITVTGSAGGMASRQFAKKAITDTRWKIDEASMVPRNQGFLREQLMAFANTPILTQAPARVRRWFVKSMEFPNSSELIKDTSPAAVYGRGVVEMLLGEQWVWPDTSDADNESVVRDIVVDAKYSSLFDKASEKAKAMFEQYLDWSEWVVTNMTKGGAPGYSLRQTMIQMNGDWTQPPPAPAGPPGGPPGAGGPPPGGPPPEAPPPQAPPQNPMDVYGPEPVPQAEEPPALPPEIMAMISAGAGGQPIAGGGGPGMANAPTMVSPGQPQGPGTEA